MDVAIPEEAGTLGRQPFILSDTVASLVRYEVRRTNGCTMAARRTADKDIVIYEKSTNGTKKDISTDIRTCRFRRKHSIGPIDDSDERMATQQPQEQQAFIHTSKPSTTLLTMNNTSNNKEQPNSSLSIDPGILEMGASVSVNDEMRRSLATETAEIDAACTKLLSEVQTEESQSTELKKSQSHADMELSGMLQSAKELVDTMHMNEQVFRDLQSKVETDLEKTVIQKHDSEKSINDTKTHSPTSVLGIQQSIHQKQEHVTAICQDIQHIKAEIQNWESQSNHLMEEKAVLQNKIKSEHLKITLANHKHKTQILEDLLKDTQIRRHTQKAACDLIQARIEKLSETLRTAVRLRLSIL